MDDRNRCGRLKSWILLVWQNITSEHRWHPSHFRTGWKMIRHGEGHWSLEVRDIRWWERLVWMWYLISERPQEDDNDTPMAV